MIRYQLIAVFYVVWSIKPIIDCVTIDFAFLRSSSKLEFRIFFSLIFDLYELNTSTKIPLRESYIVGPWMPILNAQLLSLDEVSKYGRFGASSPFFVLIHVLKDPFVNILSISQLKIWKNLHNSLWIIK